MKALLLVMFGILLLVEPARSDPPGCPAIECPSGQTCAYIQQDECSGCVGGRIICPVYGFCNGNLTCSQYCGTKIVTSSCEPGVKPNASNRLLTK